MTRRVSPTPPSVHDQAAELESLFLSITDDERRLAACAHELARRGVFRDRGVTPERGVADILGCDVEEARKLLGET